MAFCFLYNIARNSYQNIDLTYVCLTISVVKVTQSCSTLYVCLLKCLIFIMLLFLMVSDWFAYVMLYSKSWTFTTGVVMCNKKHTVCVFFHSTYWRSTMFKSRWWSKWIDYCHCRQPQIAYLYVTLVVRSTICKN